MAFKYSDFDKEYYKLGEVAQIFDVHPQTVQRWDREGQMKFIRSNTNRRLLPKKELLNKLKELNMLEEQNNRKDLLLVFNDELKYLITNITDLNKPIIVNENELKKAILKIIDLAMQDEIERVFYKYDDLEKEYDFEYLKLICKHKNIELVNESQP